MLFLLNFQNSPVLESPLHDIGIRRNSLDGIARLQGTPEMGEALELDEMPDVGEFGFDDGGFRDRRRSWDSGCHGDGLLFWCGFVVVLKFEVLVCLRVGVILVIAG